MPAKANSGRSSLREPDNVFLVSGFGSGAYGEAVGRHQAAVLWFESHIRQCGDDVLRMLVTGGPPVRGGGMPQRIIVISRPSFVLRITGAG